jgi:transposase
MPDYNTKTIYLGIDVHKASYSVTAICEGDVVKRDKLIASPQNLVDYCFNHFKGAYIKSAYEAGFSGFHLHRFLISHNIENIVVHAASIEVSSRDTVKTDRRDSLKIATQLAANRLHCIFIPSREREDKRNLTRLRECFVKQKIRTACQLKSLLQLHGVIPYNKSPLVCEKWLKSLENLKIDKNLQYSIKQYSHTWRYFKFQLKHVEEEIQKEMESEIMLTDIYCSIPGIGRKSASILINELGDTLQFSNEEKLFSHAGLTPSEYSSGEHKRQGHINRQGKPILRRILVQAAWKAIKRDPSLRVNFERIKQRAGKKRAIVAIARMLLSRIRSCIKRKGLYLVVVEKEKTEACAKPQLHTTQAI